MTLKELWESKGFTPSQLAGLAGITHTTLYKMHAKRPKQDVNFKTVKAVCKVLGISLDDYDKLDPCPNAEKYEG